MSEHGYCSARAHLSFLSFTFPSFFFRRRLLPPPLLLLLLLPPTLPTIASVVGEEYVFSCRLRSFFFYPEASCVCESSTVLRKLSFSQLPICSCSVFLLQLLLVVVVFVVVGWDLCVFFFVCVGEFFFFLPLSY